MKILVTGGSGFIGSNVIKRLGGRFSFSNFDIRNNVKDDVRDVARLKKAVQGVDGVLHLAAISRPKWGYENPHVCLDTNIMGTVNVLEALRVVNLKAWVIFGSSREVFGGVTTFPIVEKNERMPLNAYGVSKVAGEDLLKQYAANYGLRCLTVRFCGVYTGIGDIMDRVIPRFIRQALRNEAITIEGNGKQKIGDYVYIDNVVDGLDRAIRFVCSKQKSFYDDINFVADDPISLYDLARLVARLSGSKSRITKISDRSYDTKGFWGSYAKARRVLGWKPRISLEQGLTRSIKELRPYLTPTP